MGNDRELYGAQELADIFDVKVQTITMWVSRGKLPEPTERLACGPIWTREQIEPIIAEKMMRLGGA